MSFFSRLKDGLAKTRKGITEKIDQVLVSFGKVDEELFEELEEVLVTADLGVETAVRIMDDTRKKVKEKKITDPLKIRELIRETLIGILGEETQELDIESSPAVIMVTGVNGVGKTTSIGKIAYNLKNQGKKVMLAAADTFRAAAIDQLEVWAKRAGAELIRQQEGSDPAAVVYDAIQAAKARKVDVLICDTAGRLHTKKNLMEELRKVSRIIDREMPGAKRENLLVLDATTGQNAVSRQGLSEKSHITRLCLQNLTVRQKADRHCDKVSNWGCRQADRSRRTDR